MYKGIIFDMDGVLVNSMPYHAKAWVKVFSDMGIKITEDQIYDIEGSNHMGVIDIFFTKAGRQPDPDMYETILSRKREYFFGNNDTEAFEGMYECLEYLNEDLMLAVASGADRTIVSSLIEKFYSGIFDVIISGEDVSKGKPDPEPYEKAVRMLGLKREECLVIENAPLGIRSAKEAGIFCVGIPTYLDASKIKEADLILKDHAALIDYLKGLHS